MNDWGMLATYLLCLLSKIDNPELTSQFTLVKGPDSNRVNDLLINKRIPVTLYNNLLTFRNADKKVELEEDFSEIIIIRNYNVDLVRLSDLKKSCFNLQKIEF